MAKTSKTAPALPPEEPVAVPAVSEDNTPSYIDLRGVLTTTAPTDRLDVQRKEQLRRQLDRLHDAIDTFFAEQLEKGLTEEEVMPFASLELPLRPTETMSNGRLTIVWPFRIVGPDGQ